MDPISLAKTGLKPPFEPAALSLPDYAELHCISNFSFLRGASFPEELVERADELGYRALAITDECSLSGVVRAHIAAKQRDIKLIIGSEFVMDKGCHLVLIACNRKGYGHLSHLISCARREAETSAVNRRHHEVLGYVLERSLQRQHEEHVAGVQRGGVQTRTWLGHELAQVGRVR